MGKSKRIAFEIRIILDCSLAISLENHLLDYKYSNGHQDNLCIEDNLIKISGDRSNKPNFEEIFINNQSEIYFQLMKSYVYYCISNGVIPEILEIRCYDPNNNVVKRYTRSTITNLQVCRDPQKLKDISKSKLSVIFKSSKEGIKHLYATTTLIRSFCSKDSNDIFEKLWKSYNSIYKIRSSKGTDRGCLDDMGVLMSTNPSDFPLSVTKVTNLDKTSILASTRWFKMLEYFYLIQGNPNTKENRLNVFLTKFNDLRLSQIALETIDFKNNFWSNSNLHAQTLTQINALIANQNTNDGEVIEVLCNYYMYFLRNKSLHGDQTDHSFRFISNNKEEKTLMFSSEILFSVVCDLINNHPY
ncbi:Uncharacterised protein [Raoultella terrigena]|uniref:hypothetical protein n=1 Tax=Raoultella terrigena TaxID=577 RepID=UPI000DF92FB2|nr:hypothetical protein [Raoultella terrigena]SUQ57184.1 Uncharacterised protein [Raoultella terrigena]